MVSIIECKSNYALLWSRGEAGHINNIVCLSSLAPLVALLRDESISQPMCGNTHLHREDICDARVHFTLKRPSKCVRLV